MQEAAIDVPSLMKFWPTFVLVSTPFISQAIKKMAPVWEKRLGENYVFVVMSVGIVMNLLGYSISPDAMLFATDVPSDSTSTALGVASAALTGAGIGFGASKIYDKNKGRSSATCVPKTHPPKKTTSKTAKKRTRKAKP